MAQNDEMESFAARPRNKGSFNKISRDEFANPKAAKPMRAAPYMRFYSLKSSSANKDLTKIEGEQTSKSQELSEAEQREQMIAAMTLDDEEEDKSDQEALEDDSSSTSSSSEDDSEDEELAIR